MRIDPSHQWLMALPPLPEPPPRPEAKANMIGLIPLFVSPYGRQDNIHAYVRAAVHSRDSCLRHTDAIARGVPIQLYIEDVVLERCKSELLENHIDIEKDVRVFSAPLLEYSKDGVWGQLAKKMCVYYDPQFADIDWVVCWDAAVWFPKGTDFKFNFIRAQPILDIGYIEVRKNIRWTQYWEDEWLKILARMTEKSEIEMHWYVSTFEPLGLFEPGDKIQFPVGGLWTYPAAHFHTLNKDFVWWMSEYSPYFGCDEITATVWSYCFDLNIVSLTDYFGWRFISCRHIPEGIAWNSPTPTVLFGKPNSEEKLSKLLKAIGHNERSSCTPLS